DLPRAGATPVLVRWLLRLGQGEPVLPQPLLQRLEVPREVLALRQPGLRADPDGDARLHRRRRHGQPDGQDRRGAQLPARAEPQPHRRLVRRQQHHLPQLDDHDLRRILPVDRVLAARGGQVHRRAATGDAAAQERQRAVDPRGRGVHPALRPAGGHLHPGALPGGPGLRGEEPHGPAGPRGARAAGPPLEPADRRPLPRSERHVSAVASAEANREVVQAIYDAAATGDFACVQSLQANDILRLDVVTPPPPDRSEGKPAVLAAMGRLVEVLRTTEVRVHEILADGPERVAALIDAIGTDSTGQPYSMPVVELFLVRDGQVVEIRPFYYDTVRLRALVGVV